MKRYEENVLLDRGLSGSRSAELPMQAPPQSGGASVPGLTELVWFPGDNVEVGVELDVVFAAAAFGVVDLV